jgi:hypothetical protein
MTYSIEKQHEDTIKINNGTTLNERWWKHTIKYIVVTLLIKVRKA